MHRPPVVAVLAPLLLAGCVPPTVAADAPPPAPTTSTPDPVRVTMSPDPVPTTAPDPAPTTAAPDPTGTVALTFDDGPGPHTADVLEVLLEHGATATFFVVGAHLPGHGHTVTELLDAGMSVQWHSRSHADLTRLSDASLVHELTVPAELSALGADPTCVRPPYGAVDARVVRAAQDAGLSTTMWDVDPRDWDAHDPDALADAVLSGLDPGDVVLLHDGGGDRGVTVQALSTILERLDEDGWTTVRLCEENPV